MEVNDILAIIDRVCEKENIGRVKIRDGEFRLIIEKNQAVYMKQEAPVQVSTTNEMAGYKAEDVKKTESSEVGVRNVVKSPLVGTFYAAPAEDKPSYVTLGSRVTKGQVLGIVEAMKLMNEIECEYDGVVEDILVENGDMVEYGQELFIIVPA